MQDAEEIAALIELSIARLLPGFLTHEQVAHSRSFMALDTQLIEDGTYFTVKDAAERLVGCGGWSFRATVYGGDRTAGRDARILNPANEPARIRAMYTHPDVIRSGIGGLILQVSEAAAARAGFRSVVLGATIAGEPLYRAQGFEELSRRSDGGVPIVQMGKDLS